MIILFFIYFTFAILVIFTIYKLINSMVVLSYKEPLENIQFVYNYSDENKECSICLENNTNVKLHCDHHFHEHCILEWFQYNATCPICRIQV